MGKTKKEQRTLFDCVQSEEETAEELYREIQEEKQRLIRNGKIRKEKALPGIKRDEIPFKLPKRWKWVRMSEILDVRDGTHDTPAYTSVGIPLVTSKNLVNGRIDFETAKLISIEDAKLINIRSAVDDGDVLYAMIGSIGNPVLVKKETEFCIKNMALFKPICKNKFLMEFLLFFLQKEQHYMRCDASGGLQPFVSLTFLRSYLCPLPPLSEQKRIVSLIESLFSRLDEARAKAREVIDGFELWKSAILHKAFTGRLVEQRPEEGTGEELFREIQAEKQLLVKEGKIKKEKPLPEIKEDEIPFEIPEGWKWVRLASICNSISAGGDKPKDFVKEKDSTHQIPVVANGVSNDGIIGYTKVATAPSNTLTVAGRGTIGFSCYRNYEYCPIIRLNVIEQNHYIVPQYLYFVFQKLTPDSVGSSIPQLTVPMIRPKLIPLPPLAEQKQIVSQIESLFSRMEEAVDKAKAVVEQIDAIKKSILEKAFRGELGTNDPTEESALTLLKSAE
ncbi:MAG: restriction endonuclease subunit S [Thermoguttaceae bacterium]|nr:restriction endonuclease subunit S [Thermoguttaceae bacterium]